MTGVVFGKRGGGGLGVVMKGVIVLIALSLIAHYELIPKKPAHAAINTVNEFTDDIGLDQLIDIANIKSISFGVDEKTGALNVNWRFNKDGENALNEGADVRVTFLHREIPGADLKEACVGFRIVSDESLAEKNKAAAIGLNCSVDSGGLRAGLHSLKGGKAGPAPSGEYVVAVAIKKFGDVRFGEGKEGFYKFYTEDFVELRDKPINGCGNALTKQCNVIECKKARMNDALNPSGFPSGAERKKIAKEVVSGTCATYDDSTIPPTVKFDACTKPEDVDFVNTKFARLWMFRDAYRITGLKSESEYSNYADKIGDFKLLGVADSLVCSKGVYEYLNNFGWAPVPVGSLDKWSGKITNELDRVLRDELKLKPVIANLRAEFSSDKSITLKWDPIGLGNIDNYEVQHCWRKYARDKHFVSDAADIEISGEESLCYPTVKLSKESKEVPFSAADLGLHNFTVKAMKGGTSVLVKFVKTGLFTGIYMELYNGVYGYPNYKDKTKREVITVCVRGSYATKDDNCDNSPNPSNGNLAECDNDCNVFEKKRAQFKRTGIDDPSKNDKWRVRNIVWQNWKIGKVTGCEYKEGPPKTWELDDCNQEEVDELYNELLKAVYSKEDLCTLEKNGPSDFKIIWAEPKPGKKLDVDYEAVCKVKENLADNLGNYNRLNWAYFAS